MDLYPLLLFVHVLGGVALFVSLGIELVALHRLRAARGPDAARDWLGLLNVRLGIIAMSTTLLAGVWLMAIRWGPQPWILMAVIGLVAMAVIAGAISVRGTRRLHAALSTEGGRDLSQAAGSQSWGRPLLAAVWLRMAIATGILGLMTVKPDLAGSLLLMTAAVVAGALVASLDTVRSDTDGRTRRT